MDHNRSQASPEHERAEAQATVTPSAGVDAQAEVLMLLRQLVETQEEIAQQLANIDGNLQRILARLP